MSLQWTTISNPSAAPSNPGVYQYLKNHRIIYIGKAVNLRARLKSHQQIAKYDRHEMLIQKEHTSIRYTLTDSDFLATLLEAKLISKHLPRYNRVLRDNKSYLYIAIDLKAEYPKPKLVRGRDLPAYSQQLNLYGPFQTRKVAEDILATIRHLIPYCQQNRVGSRACFYHKLGLCDPCPSQINQQKNKDLKLQANKRYHCQIRQICKILSGEINPVLRELEDALSIASEQENFEQALELRDRLYRFRTNLVHRHFYDAKLSDYSQSEQALKELTKLLSPYFPNLSLNRIEGYDASTFQLNNSVVSLVVMSQGQIDKGEYRRFKLKNPHHRSDFTMLKEALSRRLRNKRWPQTDLLVIDGGRPQLRQIQPLLDELPSPPAMLGLAKHPDKIIILPDTTLKLPPDSPALQLLQRLRNEAHRFANSYRILLEKKSKNI